MSKTFDMPVRATEHCRHYSYDLGLHGRGPQCAVGIDQQLAPSPAVSRCCSGPTEPCPKRIEYTDCERAAWASEREERMNRLGAAVTALPRPIPLRTSGTVDCPSCEGGKITYARWERGAELACSTPNCCAARFNIKPHSDWPVL